MAEINQIHTYKKLSLRDKLTLTEYPFLAQVREAVICAYDVLEANRHLPSFHDANDKDKMALAKMVGDGADDNTLSATYDLYNMTKYSCEITVLTALAYLETHYRGEFDLSFCTTRDSKFFTAHMVALIVHKETDTAICFSPGSILHNYTEKGFVFPVILNERTGETSIYQRSTDVFLANSIEDVLIALKDAEGGNVGKIKPFDSNSAEMKLATSSRYANATEFVKRKVVEQPSI